MHIVKCLQNHYNNFHYLFTNFLSYIHNCEKIIRKLLWNLLYFT